MASQCGIPNDDSMGNNINKDVSSLITHMRHLDMISEQRRMRAIGAGLKKVLAGMDLELADIRSNIQAHNGRESLQRAAVLQIIHENRSMSRWLLFNYGDSQLNQLFENFHSKLAEQAVLAAFLFSKEHKSKVDNVAVPLCPAEPTNGSTSDPIHDCHSRPKSAFKSSDGIFTGVEVVNENSVDCGKEENSKYDRADDQKCASNDGGICDFEEDHYGHDGCAGSCDGIDDYEGCKYRGSEFEDSEEYGGDERSEKNISNQEEWTCTGPNGQVAEGEATDHEVTEEFDNDDGDARVLENFLVIDKLASAFEGENLIRACGVKQRHSDEGGDSDEWECVDKRKSQANPQVSTPSFSITSAVDSNNSKQNATARVSPDFPSLTSLKSTVVGDEVISQETGQTTAEFGRHSQNYQERCRDVDNVPMLASFVLIAMFFLSMAVISFAASSAGSILVENLIEGYQPFSIRQIKKYLS